MSAITVTVLYRRNITLDGTSEACIQRSIRAFGAENFANVREEDFVFLSRRAEKSDGPLSDDFKITLEVDVDRLLDAPEIITHRFAEAMWWAFASSGAWTTVTGCVHLGDAQAKVKFTV